jgi:hypothetical protein
MKKHALIVVVFVLLALLALSCEKELPGSLNANQSPRTRLWISSEGTLNETLSKQHLYYYGEDPDGFITGYLIAIGDSSFRGVTAVPAPDTLTYIWTTRTDTVISFPLRKLRDSITVFVRAVDNHFVPGNMPSHSFVKGFPNPYWDKDSNGFYSPGDVYLTALPAAADPRGAVQRIPIVNTPPNVQFAMSPGDNPVTIEQPETTFTATTFSWVGSDDDGNQTLKSYRLALNDTTNPANWYELPSSAFNKDPKEADTVKVMLYVKRQDSDNAGATVDAEVYTGVIGNLQRQQGTLKNLKLNAENVLYVEAKDLAGEYSKAARMPSVPTTKWFVKKPGSRMLIVGDYSFSKASDRNWILNFYHGVLTDPSILNGQLQNFDSYGFDRSKQNNYLNYWNPAFVKTLQMYDVVLWFTDVSPNISAAQVGLFYYVNTLNTERNTYGHVIFTTQYPNSPDTPTPLELRAYNDFAPLDSTTRQLQYMGNGLYVKDSMNVSTKILPMQSGYPTLYVDSITTGGVRLSGTGKHTVYYRKLYKRTDSQYIYEIDTARVKTLPYQGMLELGIIDNQKRFVMFGLPLHLLNGWEHNLPLFFKKVIEDEFGLR